MTDIRCHGSRDQDIDAFELLLRRSSARALARCLLTGSLATATGCLGDELNPGTKGTGLETGQGAGPSGSDGGYQGDDGGSRAVADGSTEIGPTSPTDSGLPPGPGEAAFCPPGLRFPVQAANLAPTQSYDYVAVREVRDFGGPLSDAGSGWNRTTFEVLSETGVTCATATGPDCATTVARHPDELWTEGSVQVLTERSVVTTRGDEVAKWANPTELIALLGSIDTFDDAMMLVNAAGYTLTCNDAVRTSLRELDDGYEVYATRMTEDCAPIVIKRFRLHVSRAGVITNLGSEVLSQEGACVGRKPAGLIEPLYARRSRNLGEFLARAAHLEAASVHAFERLALELEQLGARPSLIARAHSARQDEIRHAQIMTRLARARGATPPEVQLEPLGQRDIEAIALENAVEGCVRETYGALVGAFQGANARDPELRAVMQHIAEDERHHAALSHAIHAWLMPQLSPAARRRVRRAQTSAITELAGECTRQVPDALRVSAGLPARDQARALLSELSRSLWTPALAA